MNKFIQAIKDLDLEAVEEFVQKDPKWLAWSEPDGKNALHFLCGVRPCDVGDADASLRILKWLLKRGMDINSVQRVEEKNCNFFPATPLWYAFTKGQNETLYKYLLKQGADPSHCWWAIAWYDDAAAAKLWLKHGAKLDEKPSLNDLFLGSFQWKKFTFAKWLLSEGADVNARGPQGLTALMLAVKRKDEDAVKWLVSAGADPDLKNEQGISARKLAEEKGPRRISSLF